MRAFIIFTCFHFVSQNKQDLCFIHGILPTQFTYAIYPRNLPTQCFALFWRTSIDKNALYNLRKPVIASIADHMLSVQDILGPF